RRIKGDVYFFRDWESYKNGFGKPDSGGDFWLGNEAVHILTYVKPHELRVEIRHEGRDYFAQYKTFNLESEANKYRIQLGDVSGSIDDGSSNAGLSYSNGMYFSTFDRDNDSHKALKCALNLKAGWWYKRCYRSLLNAPLTDGNNQCHNDKDETGSNVVVSNIQSMSVYNIISKVLSMLKKKYFDDRVKRIKDKIDNNAAVTGSLKYHHSSPNIMSVPLSPSSEINLIIMANPIVPSSEINFIIMASPMIPSSEINLIKMTNPMVPRSEINLIIMANPMVPSREINLIKMTSSMVPSREIIALKWPTL
ncbi:hypothetical protein RRG08_002111, partial [Elysia crispata]